MSEMNEHTYRRMLKARSMIDHSSASFDLPRLARDMNMTPGSLVRTFKQAFDESPYRYLRRRRIERAKELLLSTTEPATDIGFAVGFVDRSSFDAAFAEFAGTSPEVYRRRTGRTTDPRVLEGRIVDTPAKPASQPPISWSRLLGGR